MTFRFAAWSIFVLTLASAGRTDEPVAANVTVEAGYATSYVFRGLKLSGAAWQPALSWEKGSWSAGIWSNVPTDRHESHEIDPWVFYSWESAGIECESGAQLYTYPESHGADTRYSYEFSFGGSRELKLTETYPVKASATLFYDPRLQTLTTEASLAHTTAFGSATKPLDLAWGVFAGYVDARDLAPDDPAPKWRDAYWFYGAKLELAAALTAQASLKLTAQWDDARHADPFQGDTGNTSGAVALSWKW